MNPIVPMAFASLIINSNRSTVLKPLMHQAYPSPNIAMSEEPLLWTSNSAPFSLPDLDYPYNALEPYIDEATMRIHHLKHHQGYIDKLNNALSKYPELSNVTLEELLSDSENLPSDIAETVRNNGGGHYNHSFFWKIMTPNGSPLRDEGLREAIEQNFGSFNEFKSEFKQVAMDTFGSGWTWLLKDGDDELRIVSTPNQDTPVPFGLTPIIAIDLWEHAYYLKHQNKRDNYIDDWFNVVNWDYAETLYNT